MKIEVQDGFVDISVAEKGTVGIPYECMLFTKVKSTSFYGESSAWVEGYEIKSFIEDLEKLASTSKGEAELTSESPENLQITFKPVDSLGHFVIKISVGKLSFIQSEQCIEKTDVAFSVATEQLSKICNQIISYLNGELSA